MNNLYSTTDIIIPILARLAIKRYLITTLSWKWLTTVHIYEYQGNLFIKCISYKYDVHQLHCQCLMFKYLWFNLFQKYLVTASKFSSFLFIYNIRCYSKLIVWCNIHAQIFLFFDFLEIPLFWPTVWNLPVIIHDG